VKNNANIREDSMSDLLDDSVSDSSFFDTTLSGEEGSKNKIRGDFLLRHIEEYKLGLVPRAPTRNDGNCWYDAVADQIRLHNLPGLPTDHVALRQCVVRSIPNLPQAKDWIDSMFGTEKEFVKFLEAHSMPGAWTDNLGIMCQATALLVKREIRLVGTANNGQPGLGFTTLESVEGANSQEPLTIGYYQGCHFQSLQKIENIKNEENLLVDDSNDESDMEDMNDLQERYKLPTGTKVSRVERSGRNLLKNLLFPKTCS